MCQLCIHQKAAAATVLFRQGTLAQSAIIVEGGWIKLVREEKDGQVLIVALYPPGSLLGAETLISNQHHSATAITLTSCFFYSVPVLVFLNWVRTDPHFSWQIHRAFSRKINARDTGSAQSKCLSPRFRLEQILRQLLCAQNQSSVNGSSKWDEAGYKLLIPLQRQELAQMIYVTPEHLSRLLREMENDCIIRRDRGWLVVTAPDKLWGWPEIQAMTGVGLIQPGVPDLPDVILA
jgi:CRP-like cAMP-binding protein